MKRLAAILLAAGSSRRMGAANKLLLPFGETTVLGRTLDTLLASAVDEVVVVLGHDALRVRQEIMGRKVIIVENHDHENGMTGSIQAGVAAVSAGYGFLICLADQVLLQTEQVNLLVDNWQQASEDAIVLPQRQQRRGHPVIFSPCYREEILALPPGDGCKSIVQSHFEHLVRIDVVENGFFADVDTPDDYTRLVP